MNAMFLRRACKPTVLMSISSTFISPASNSHNLNNVYNIDDFPAPVLPTIPTFILG